LEAVAARHLEEAVGLGVGRKDLESSSFLAPFRDREWFQTALQLSSSESTRLRAVGRYFAPPPDPEAVDAILSQHVPSIEP
jgi:hypothetical protein